LGTQNSVAKIDSLAIEDSTMKTDLLVTQNSVEIASAYMLLLTQKSLMKNESLLT
jgi:hypothetical protein